VIKKLQEFLIIDFYTFFLDVSLNRNFLLATNGGPASPTPFRAALCNSWLVFKQFFSLSCLNETNWSLPLFAPPHRADLPAHRFGGAFARFTPVFVQFVAFRLPQKVSLL
jgi:hypothetical protein